jgi:hypothetical protein
MTTEVKVKKTGSPQREDSLWGVVKEATLFPRDINRLAP